MLWPVGCSVIGVSKSEDEGECPSNTSLTSVPRLKNSAEVLATLRILAQSILVSLIKLQRLTNMLNFGSIFEFLQISQLISLKKKHAFIISDKDEM